MYEVLLFILIIITNEQGGKNLKKLIPYANLTFSSQMAIKCASWEGFPQ